MSYLFDYYDNYIFENNLNRNIPVYNVYDITTKQFI